MSQNLSSGLEAESHNKLAYADKSQADGYYKNNGKTDASKAVYRFSCSRMRKTSHWICLDVPQTYCGK